MNAGAPLVSVIIVNWNGRRLLGDCLSAVLAQEFSPFELILVDNGSTDGSVSFVRSAFPLVRVMEAGTNLGFAGGNNLGISQARANLVVLLNNDTIVEPGWLAALVKAAEPADVAVASSLVLTRGIPPVYYERNGSINFAGHNIMRVFSLPENIFYGTGASLLYRKDVLGVPFDVDYFAYGEDVYLGLRARFKGYRIVHVNESVVRHLGGAASGERQNRFLLMLQERNRVLNLILFFSWHVLLRVTPFLAANAVAKLCAGLCTRKYSFRAMLAAYGWLLCHPAAILRKRRRLRRERRVPDREVLLWMTARVTNGESGFGRMLDRVAILYCRLVGLRTVESLPRGTR